MCRTGIDAEGLGRDHWNEMLAYPRKPITHWHPLVEVSSEVFFSIYWMFLSLSRLHASQNHENQSSIYGADVRSLIKPID